MLSDNGQGNMLFALPGQLWRNNGFRMIRDIVFAILATKTSMNIADSIYKRGFMALLNDAVLSTKKQFFSLLRKVPIADKKIRGELVKVLSDLEGTLAPHIEHIESMHTLPTQGLSIHQINTLLDLNKVLDCNKDLESGKVSGTVYGMNKELRKVMVSAFEKYIYSNPLHPDVFQSTRRMESEVVSMTIALYNGLPNQHCGTMTSGGTESILLACKAYRDQARHERGIQFPEIIAATSAHVSFEKAAEYFGIKLVQVPIDEESGTACVSSMKRAINGNTIALVASAPCYSLGTMDDIESISKLASSRRIGCHVDACLGSFALPFFPQGRPFDFRLPGVTSISCDPHKYGQSPKGSSVIMYSSSELRRWQYFVSVGWSGGICATPTFMGSRSGAMIACCWAAMLAMGQEGYRNCAKHLFDLCSQLLTGLVDIPQVFVFGKPVGNVVAIGSRKLNIYILGDEMRKHGWHLNALQNPPALHLALTHLSTHESVQAFLSDLKNCISAVMANPMDSVSVSGSAGIYGTSASIPDKSIVADVAKGYLDILYKVDK